MYPQYCIHDTASNFFHNGLGSPVEFEGYLGLSVLKSFERVEYARERYREALYECPSSRNMCSKVLMLRRRQSEKDAQGGGIYNRETSRMDESGPDQVGTT